jgi:tetratricopeptide (TPR) repeat protein
LPTSAQLLRQQGKLAEARQLLERALAIYEKTCGPDHASTAAALIGLAQVRRAEKDCTVAHELFRRALAICQKLYGPDNPETKRCGWFTADALDALGRGDEALALREKYGITPEKPSA